MREISVETIKNTIKDLFIDANKSLCREEETAILTAAQNEDSPLGKKVMKMIADNLFFAKNADLPICQDTGMAVVFIDIGQDVHITGGDLSKAINDGVAQAYTDGKLRASVVKDPVFDRSNTKNNTPAIVHTNIISGDKIKITAVPKG